MVQRGEVGMSPLDIAAARDVIARRTTCENRGFSSECMIWVGCSLPSGYGKLRFQKADWLAHRLAHAAFNGAIPEGYQVDHLCEQKDCCNPDHLEAVTPQTNTVRALVANGQRLAPDICKNGHHRTEGNLHKGRCKQCTAASVQRWKRERSHKRDAIEAVLRKVVQPVGARA